MLRGMWDLPRPGLEPVSHTLAGGFLTTVPPGKSWIFKILVVSKDHSLRISLRTPLGSGECDSSYCLDISSHLLPAMATSFGICFSSLCIIDAPSMLIKSRKNLAVAPVHFKTLVHL